MAVTIIITLPYAKEAENPIIPSTTVEPDHSNHQPDHPRESRLGSQDATIPAAGTDLAIHLAGIPTDLKAKAFSTALPPNILVGLPEETGDPSPTVPSG